MFKIWILRIRENIWFKPIAYCVFSFFLAIGIILIDTEYAEQTQASIPVFLLTGVDLAQTILSSIAASLLTMTTITFSTIMVVLTTYSSQFSPRTLSNFVTNQVTMRVLGIFMGGFVYCILSLLFVSQDDTQQVLSASIGVIVALICLSYFAYFIHHVATSIQVSNLVDNLAEDTNEAMNECEKSIFAEASVCLFSEKPELPVRHKLRTQVHSEVTGYIQFIDYPKLAAASEQYDLVIEIHQPIGAFVTPYKPLVSIFHMMDELELNSLSYIHIGRERTTLQDIDFGLQKIVEVSLRAISPAINDPNTAIACIMHLGVLLAQACKKDGSYLIYHDKEQQVKLVARQRNAEHLLYSTFYQICYYGNEDISILLAIYDALVLIAEANEDNIGQKVWEFSQYVEKSFNHDVLQELDYEYLSRKKHELALAAGVQES